jgi:SSS family solute:Na+ symporter
MGLVVALYTLVVAYLAWYGYRRTRAAEDYLVAGRKVHPVIMALDYGSTFISTSAIVGFGGAAALFGMGLLWLTVLNILVGIFIAYVVFGKRVRRMGMNMGALTYPEFLARRYQSRFIQIFVGVMIFLFMPLYAGVVIIGGARFFEVALNVDYNIALLIISVVVVIWVVYGGLIAISYTNALNGAIMLFSMLLLLFSTYAVLGGFTAAHEKLAGFADVAVKAFHESGKLPGHTGWHTIPEFASVTWWILVSTLILGVGIGVLAQPQLTIRFMTVESTKSLNRAVGTGAFFVFMMTGTAFIVGTLSNVFFLEKYGKPAIAVAGGNIDKIIPTFINAFMPEWFVALFMIALIAAAMSTVGSLIFTIGSSLGRDVYEQGIRQGAGGESTVSTVNITRMAVVVGVAVSLILAYILPGSIIARGTAIFFALMAESTLPAFAGALFWRGATKAGAISSMLVGFFGALFYLTFIHASEAKPLGISQALLGKPTLVGLPWTVIDPLVVVLPISVAVFVVVSLMTSPPPEEHVKRCFEGVMPKEAV